MKSIYGIKQWTRNQTNGKRVKGSTVTYRDMYTDIDRAIAKIKGLMLLEVGEFGKDWDFVGDNYQTFTMKPGKRTRNKKAYKYSFCVVKYDLYDGGM